MNCYTWRGRRPSAMEWCTERRVRGRGDVRGLHVQHGRLEDHVGELRHQGKECWHVVRLVTREQANVVVVHHLHTGTIGRHLRLDKGLPRIVASCPRPRPRSLVSMTYASMEVLEQAACSPSRPSPIYACAAACDVS
jgi:hypothetical protein